MSWLEHHRLSESRAAAAEEALRQGDRALAEELYAEAAEAEKAALADLDPSKTRTLGVCAVSAVSLYYKATCFQDAETLAINWMASASLPGFAKEQLRNLLQSVWSEQVRERAGVRFVPGQVMISVKGGVTDVGEAVDDVIGPMVNKPVVVEIAVDDHGRRKFVDIEPDD
ncbi:MAG: hypothetical protein LGR52_09265 [Candidatus Thiosymbion ectosymbiont of Robbea hypermnestra]|nr:hypothetical protein [Candidatus Thiosymbion ectosymbiont of Robbea hypermnestra]